MAGLRGAGGFTFKLEDLHHGSIDELADADESFMLAAKQPELDMMYNTVRIATPQVHVIFRLSMALPGPASLARRSRRRVAPHPGLLLCLCFSFCLPSLATGIRVAVNESRAEQEALVGAYRVRCSQRFELWVMR